MASTLPDWDHMLWRGSRDSIMYFVIGNPPSFSDGFHFSVQPVSVISDTASGPFGIDGISGEEYKVVFGLGI